MKHARPRYLESKRTVDARARSPRVRDRLLAELPDEPTILEAGCGTGATVPQLLSWGVDAGRYRGIDTDERIVSFAREVRPPALRRAGHTVTVAGTDRPVSRATASPPDFAVEDLSISFETGDALDALESAGSVDLVVAQSFADLVPLDRFVSAIESALRPGGLAYLPLTFDGGTIFQPDHPDDAAVERAYHAAIDDAPGRDVRAGRHLADKLRKRDGDLLAMASSDWVVRPQDGRYRADERYFLAQILGFVAGALSEAADAPEGFDSWLSTRWAQLDAGTLLYVAHQYDLLYRAQ
ncbi:class I SAM-dependent methyltransferase [Halobellus rufus]|uniref:class I SAM-dependent methyltransferase n=1 Tax=Halobellus rufus TaxID=1448860 RepID=UPI000678FEAC|nr:class I SAM-dependent methyltransferase [Halobellus rufus]